MICILLWGFCPQSTHKTIIYQRKKHVLWEYISPIVPLWKRSLQRSVQYMTFPEDPKNYLLPRLDSWSFLLQWHNIFLRKDHERLGIQLLIGQFFRGSYNMNFSNEDEDPATIQSISMNESRCWLWSKLQINVSSTLGWFISILS